MCDGRVQALNSGDSSITAMLCMLPVILYRKALQQQGLTSCTGCRQKAARLQQQVTGAALDAEQMSLGACTAGTDTPKQLPKAAHQHFSSA